MKWKKKLLGDVFEIARGGSPRPIDKYITTSSDGYNWIMIGDAPEGSKYITDIRKKISPEGLSKTRQVKPGDFLLTNSMSFGRPFILKTSGCIHDGWLVLSPRSDDVLPDYFYYLLGSETLKRQFIKGASGAVVKNLNTKMVKNVSVNVPPLAEQKRIAGILDAADALRAKRRESLSQLDSLLQSTFLDMFGDPVTNPMGWNIFPLLNIAELENGDRSSNYPSGPDVVDQGVLFLSTKNIVDYHLALDECQFITQKKFDSLSRGKLQRRDIVITLRGTLGSCAVFDCRFDTGFINAQLLIIRPRKVDPMYLHGLLSSQPMHSHFARLATGVAVKQLTGKQIGALAIPFPPLDLQQRFAAVVKSVEQQKARVRHHLAELGRLFASLQSRAFNGEL